MVTHDDGVFLGVEDGTFSGELSAPLLKLRERQVDEPFKAKTDTPGRPVKRGKTRSSEIPEQVFAKRVQRDRHDEETR